MRVANRRDHPMLGRQRVWPVECSKGPVHRHLGRLDALMRGPLQWDHRMLGRQQERPARRAIWLEDGLTRDLSRTNSHQVLDEAFELAEVADFEDAVAVDAVLGDDGVAGVPVGAGLGVEPEHFAGPVLDLLEDPGLGGVVVVAGVTPGSSPWSWGRRLSRSAPRTPRRRGRSRSGRPPTPTSASAFTPVDGLADVVHPFEEAGHLVEAVDEHE